MGLFECQIINKKILSADQFMIDLRSEEIAAECAPGQFVDILCDSLLRRPFSICGVDRTSGVFRVAIRIKGSGTAYLATKQPGETLSVLGPLGHGFDLTGTRTCVVAGGGIGIYPLLFVLQEARKQGLRTVSVCGFRSGNESFCIDEIKDLSDHTLFASECGDLDVCGNTIDALQGTIDSVLSGIDPSNTTIFTCGPAPMMEQVAYAAERNHIACQVSLEERMGCGTGVCLVCACKVKAGEADFEYKRCCKDGPVFNAKEVLWESI